MAHISYSFFYIILDQLLPFFFKYKLSQKQEVWQLNFFLQYAQKDASAVKIFKWEFKKVIYPALASTITLLYLNILFAYAMDSLL